MKKIPLTQGRYAIVDDEYYELVSAYKWHLASGGYAATRPVINGKRRQIFMHRLIADPPEGFEVDHVNGDRLDNRRINLRPAHRNENAWNSRAMPRGSKYKGISFYDDHWYVRIMVNGKQSYYGRYKDERLAARIYDYAAHVDYGDFAHLNFPNEPLMSEDEFYDHIMRKPGSSQYRGVSWDKSKRKWVAHIHHKRRCIFLGRYDIEEEAAQAYNEAATKYHGNRAKLNELEAA